MRIKLAPSRDLSGDTGPTVAIAGALGQCRAIFCRLGLVDSDGDVTMPGAFEEGIEVPISAYGHTSWQGALPVGRAVIHSDTQRAWADCQFFMGTQAGRETFEVIRDLGPLQQWSWGFDPVAADSGPDPAGSGQHVQFLRRVDLHEVSPVLVGAGQYGQGLRTETEDGSVKADMLREFARFQAFALPMVEDHARDVAGREYARFVRASLAV